MTIYIRIGLFFIFVMSAQLSIAQMYLKPTYERQTNPRLTIEKVEITKDHTIIHFLYTVKQNFVSACISPDIYVEDTKTKKKYPVVKLKKIPYCPEEHQFGRVGERLRFQIYFKKVEYHVRYINIIEDMKNGFNFYKVHLKPIA